MFDDIFSRSDTILECNRQTDGHRGRRLVVCLCIPSCGKKCFENTFFPKYIFENIFVVCTIVVDR